MLRIESISINNYKNIIVDNLILSNFNVIVGPNNSGKSNFIQILSFLNHVINGSIDEIMTEFRNGFFKDFGEIKPSYVEKKKGTISVSIKFLETETKIQYQYNIGILWKNKDKPRYDLHHEIIEESFEFRDIHKTGPAKNIFNRKHNTISFGKIMKRTVAVKSIPNSVSVINLLKVVLNKDIVKPEHSSAIKALDKILKIDTIYFSNIELTKVDTSRLSKYSGRTVSYNVEKEIYNLSKNNKKYNLLKETLNKILKIQDIEIEKLSDSAKIKDESKEEEYVFFFEHMNDFKTLNELSDGSIILIALITKIISSESSIFLIEEPENSLHPKALIDLINFMRSFENEKQFILASHSISIINSIKPEDVIISKCNEDGSSILQRVSNIRELKQKLRQGFIVFSDALFFDQDEIT